METLKTTDARMSCLACGNKEFEIIITKMPEEIKRLLVLYCNTCRHPAGVVNSDASAKLLQALTERKQ